MPKPPPAFGRSKRLMQDHSAAPGAAPEPPAPQRGDPDRARVERARHGDTAAFRELVERHRDRVHGLAWRIAGSRDEAEEIAQDAFVRAWQALPLFRGESRFSTWLHRITTRVALDRREAARRRQRREVGVDDEILANLAVESDPGDDEDRMTARARIELLAGFSEAQRMAVTLHYLEDRP